MRFIYFIFISLFIASCSKTTEDLYLEYNSPVVTGFLSPNKNPEIIISGLILFDDNVIDTLSYFNSLDVNIINNEIMYPLVLGQSNPDNFVYTDSILQITPGEEYEFTFSYNDDQVSGSTIVPSKPDYFKLSTSEIELERITEESNPGPGQFAENLEITWKNNNNSYFLVTYEYLESSFDPVNETIDIENPDDNAHFTSSPLQDSTYTIRGRQFSYFGQYNIILFKISKEYASIYESLNQSSLDDLTEPVTNIHNGKGVFASFNSDTLLLNVVED